MVEGVIKKDLCVIVAMDKDGVIGKDGGIYWDYPVDLKRFSKKTKGNIVIQGRKTYESIGRLLHDRLNIIITRDKNYKVEEKWTSKNSVGSYLVVHSFEEAMEEARSSEFGERIFAIGGNWVYREAMKTADFFYLTNVFERTKGGELVYFPEFDISEWETMKRRWMDGVEFLDLERVRY